MMGARSKRSRTRCAAVCIGVALATVAVGSSAETPKARALTALDDARACAPLASGDIAVATGGGLAIVRTDGVTKTLTSLDGLPDTRVHSVVESADGLWLGTEGGAALVTTGGSPSVVRVIGSAPVRSVLVSSSGVYLGTWGAGVQHLADKASAPVLVPTSGAGKHVAAIAEHAGIVHVAYSDGPVTRLEGGVLRPVPGTPTHGQALASSGSRLVLGALEGIFRLDANVTSFASVDARGIASTPDTLFVATYGSGLLSTTPTGATFRPEAGVPRWVRGVSASLATSRCATGSACRVMACAATTEGLFVREESSRVTGAATWRKIPLGGPPSNDVTALAVSGDRVVVGTFDRGVAIHRDGAFHRITGLDPNETVNAAAWEGEHPADRGATDLWLGTAHGLVRVDASGAVTRRLRAADGLPSSIVRSILVLSRHRLLVGTDEGPVFVEHDRITPVVTPRKGGPQPLESPMHATWSLARADDGIIYLGTASGLYYGKNGAFERASVSTRDLSDDWVTALAVKSDGAKTDVFVGTYSAGVTRLTFEPGSARPRATHLGGGYVNPDGLVFRAGHLLAATMDGLLVRPIADDTAKWLLRREASPGRDVTAAREVGGSLWVASRRGIAVTP